LTGRQSARPDLPPSWAEQRARALDPKLFAPTPFERARIVLSYSHRQPFASTNELRDVAADLASGMLIEPRQGSEDQFYRLVGTRYVVNAKPITSDGAIILALAQSIKPGNGLGRVEPVRPAAVVFEYISNRVACDLSVLAEQATETLSAVRRRKALCDHVARDLSVARRQPFPHADLHAMARRLYQPLDVMIKLMEQRSRVEDSARTKAAVTAVDEDDSGRMELSVKPPAHGFVEDRFVQFQHDGRQHRVRLLEIDQRDGGLFFVIEVPDNPPRIGDVIELVQLGRFAMGRHKEAVRRFLGENVEGYWDHLAVLICEPDKLPAVAAPEPRRFLIEEQPGGPRLNPEQRRAVAGALATPHAFLIQGPPGTGKTTVIAELVLQLTARGERVLLLAPMHVAVDELLRRVGDCPGIFALRLSWDDAKVAADLRRFLPDQATRQYVRGARRPSSSRSGRWRAEMTRLTEARAAVGLFVSVRDEHEVLRHGQAGAQRAYDEWFADRDRERRSIEEELAAADRALAWYEPALSAVRADEEALDTRIEAVPTVLRFLHGLLGLVGGRSEIAALLAARRATRSRHRELRWQHESWSSHRSEVASRAARRASEFQAQDETARDALAQWHERVVAAGERLTRVIEACRSAAGLDPATTDDDQLARLRGDLSREIDRLERRIKLERRWFELSWAEALGSSAAEERMAEQFDQELRRAANLICCTTTGVASREVEDLDFDTLIVDEASRVTDSEFLIGAIRARRWILVGDERQLPPYVEGADEHHLHALTALHMVERGAALDLDAAITVLSKIWKEDEELHVFRKDTVRGTAERLLASQTWASTFQPTFAQEWRRLKELGDDAEKVLLEGMLDHLVRSLFERCVAKDPPIRQALEEQRRMIDPIALVVRDPVYAGRYRSAPPEALRACGVTPLVSAANPRPVMLFDTSAYGHQARAQSVDNGFINQLEARWVAELCRGWERDLGGRHGPRVTVSVLTFYRKQAHRIRSLLGHPHYPEFHALRFRVIDSIDKIQGQESDLVLVSFCRTWGRDGPRKGSGLWLQDIRRLNVACTRARRALALVGHVPSLEGLRGVEAAEAFYRNLLSLSQERPDVMAIVKDR